MAEDKRRRRERALAYAFANLEAFSRHVIGRPLRGYQLEPARAIARAIVAGRGLEFAVMMPRQAGKNETSAQLEAYLLNLYRRRGGSIVKAAPTLRPQGLNSLRRLEQVYERTELQPLERGQGHVLRAGRAQIQFLSGSPRANVVGATADLLLEGDEAQDQDAETWNKAFRPMTASSDAPSVLWGTAWTTRSLLYTTIQRLRWQQEGDGLQRVFIVPWQQVAQEVPAYGRHVRREVARLGRQHPLIKTQYYLESIDAQSGMFDPETLRLMQGTHARLTGPQPGRLYALLVDLAGEAEDRLEGAELREREPRRDSTAVTVVEVQPGSQGLPRYLVRDRHLWTGRPHHTLYGTLQRLAERWAAQRVVVDATGVGAGLCSFLRRALGGRLVPFAFNVRSKSELGWTFLGICRSGRFRDHADQGAADGGPTVQQQFWRQVRAAEYTIVPGPQRHMRWGVRDPRLHDDLLISAALCAVLDRDAEAQVLPSQIIEARDPLRDKGRRR